jgi:hypothetical protein
VGRQGREETGGRSLLPAQGKALTEGGTGGNRGSISASCARQALTEREGETPRVSVRTGIAELGLLGRTDGCGRALRRRRVVRRERTNKTRAGGRVCGFHLLSFENIGIILTCGERFLLIATKLFF